ncbi:MAG: S-methyl-5-thioribose-1-phosphate isomerase [Dehalococcoidia bacterium]
MKTIEWVDNKVRLLDQTRLPLEEVYLDLASYQEVVKAIKEMRVRGAPALGVAAAYGVVLGSEEIRATSKEEFMAKLNPVIEALASSRPTAVNIRWALERMKTVVDKAEGTADIKGALLDEALTIQRQDEEANRLMGEYGVELLQGATNVMTHCNAGALATAGYGTALGVIRAATEKGRPLRVFATETRPFLQGSRLTAWELARDDIDVTVITDSMVGHFLKGGEVDCVIVGADRIAANGDVANKIGTYPIAVLAKENDIPFYVAAPVSTIDLSISSGQEIPIEERSADEVVKFAGVRVAPEGVSVANPAFDVTPHRYVSAIVTERGIAREPYTEALLDLVERK